MGVVLLGAVSLGRGSVDSKLAPCFPILIVDVDWRSFVRLFEGVVAIIESKSAGGGWFSWSSSPIVLERSSFAQSMAIARRERLNRFSGRSNSARKEQ